MRYLTELFDRETIDRLLAHFTRILEGVASDPEVPISHLPMVSEAERDRAVVTWNDTADASFPDQAVHRCFEAVAAKCSGEPALALAASGSVSSSMTYGQLNAEANRLARHLQTLGVGPESPVGISSERCLEMVIGILAILKAGGAYVPFDPNLPMDRLDFIRRDTGLNILLTPSREASLGQFDGVLALPIRETLHHCNHGTGDLDTPVTPNQAAQIIYTSGSTGRPKGVIRLHRAMVNRAAWMMADYPFGVERNYCHITSLNFVRAEWELFVPLLAGKHLIIVPTDLVKDFKGLVDFLYRQQVTRIVTAPSLMRALMNEPPERVEKLAILRHWLVSGEALPVDLAETVKRRLPKLTLSNIYGCTEITSGFTWYKVPEFKGNGKFKASKAGKGNDGPGLQKTVPIGVPISNTGVFIADEAMDIAPVGGTGEICVSGACLARGYVNRAAMTAEKFIPNPFERTPGARLYRTGDMARYLRDGNVEYLGRRDFLVKIRGFRIELAEIELALNQHEQVAGGVVLAKRDDHSEVRLIAYVQAKKGSDSAQAHPESLKPQLIASLKNTLPDYMVPSVFCFMDRFPLIANGKVDRQRLPEPEFRASTHRSSLARNETEAKLVVIWNQILKGDVGIHDNFFESGGHSLLGTQVMSRIKDVCGVELPVRNLFEAPTVAELARMVSQARDRRSNAEAALVPAPKTTEHPRASMTQRRLWLWHQIEGDLPTYNISLAMEIRGVLDKSALAACFHEIVNRHDSLRTSFDQQAGEPVQVIGPRLRLPIPVVDLTGLASGQRSVALNTLMVLEKNRPFNLKKGPLIRLHLVQKDSRQSVLFLTVHHIVSDGWSLRILQREFAALYQAKIKGLPNPLATLPLQYADYAHWQRERLEGGLKDLQLNYWRRQLAGAPASLNLPVDGTRTDNQSYRGGFTTLALDAKVTSKLTRLGRAQGATTFMTLMAVFQLLLARLSKQSDVLVGTTVANRPRRALEDMVGFFVNQLVLRTRFNDNPSFVELLRQVRKTTLDAYDHADIPFDLLVEALDVKRDLGRSPLFQVLLAVHNMPKQSVVLPGFQMEGLGAEQRSSKFDLSLFFNETTEGLRATWVYNADLFQPGTIEKMKNQFATLVSGVLAHPNNPVSSLELESQAEKTRRIAAIQNRRQSRRCSLRGVKRRKVEGSPEALVTTRLMEGSGLPLVVKPTGQALDPVSWAAHHKDQIERYLQSHGGVLFRGFGTRTTADFERFASQLGSGLVGEYGDLPREDNGGKVYGSTPYPKDQSILFHNESSHMHSWPKKIFFSCLKAPSRGGETPIVDCRQVYRNLDPLLVRQFEEKGLLYVRNYLEEVDVSWQRFFNTEDPAVVNAFCKRADIQAVWKENMVLSTRKKCPAVLVHPTTGEKVFFNQICLHHIAAVDRATRESMLALFPLEDLPRNVYFGDGSVIEDSIIDEVRAVLDETSVAFPWQEGDTLMLDNMLAAHGRNPFEGERKIVVAMSDMVHESDVERIVA